MKKKQLEILADEKNKLHLVGLVLFSFQGTQVITVSFATEKLAYQTVIHLN